MLSISVYETVGNQIALVALGPHLPDCLCRDQVPAGWRMDTQLAGASDFRDRRLLHRYRPQLRRPLAFGHTSLADQEGSVYGRAWRVCGTIMNRLGDRPTRRQATPPGLGYREALADANALRCRVEDCCRTVGRAAD